MTPRSIRRVVALAVCLAFVSVGCNGSSGVDHLSKSNDPSQFGLNGVTATTTKSGVSRAIVASYQRFEGGTGRLADYTGRALVVNFFASTCVPCVTEMPDIERLHQRYGPAVAFVGIDTELRMSDGKAIAAKTKVTYDLGFDPDGTLLQGFGGLALPVTVLIRPDGTVADRHIGALSATDLAGKIRAELGVS